MVETRSSRSGEHARGIQLKRGLVCLDGHEHVYTYMTTGAGSAYSTTGAGVPVPQQQEEPPRRVPCRTWMAQFLQEEALRSRPHPQFRLCAMADRSSAQTLRCLSVMDRLDLRDLNDFLDDLQMWDLDCLHHGLHPPNSRSGETGAVTNKGGADSAGRDASISITSTMSSSATLRRGANAQTLKGEPARPAQQKTSTSFSLYCKLWSLYRLRDVRTSKDLTCVTTRMSATLSMDCNNGVIGTVAV